MGVQRCGVLHPLAFSPADGQAVSPETGPGAGGLGDGAGGLGGLGDGGFGGVGPGALHTVRSAWVRARSRFGTAVLIMSAQDLPGVAGDPRYGVRTLARVMRRAR